MANKRYETLPHLPERRVPRRDGTLPRRGASTLGREPLKSRPSVQQVESMMKANIPFSGFCHETSDVNLAITDEILKCKICCANFCRVVKIPRLLACSHTICETCLKQCIGLLEGRQNVPSVSKFCCPLCHRETPMPFGVESIPCNITIINLLEILDQKQGASFHSSHSSMLSLSSVNIPPIMPQRDVTSQTNANMGKNIRAENFTNHSCHNDKLSNVMKGTVAASSDYSPPVNPSYMDSSMHSSYSENSCNLVGTGSPFASNKMSPSSSSTSPAPFQLPVTQTPVSRIIESSLRLLCKFGCYVASGTVPQAGQFCIPARIAVNRYDRVAIVDTQLMYVHLLTSHGDPLCVFRVVGVQSACFINADRVVVASHKGIAVYSTSGVCLQQLEGPVQSTIYGVSQCRIGFVSVGKNGIGLFKENLILKRSITHRTIFLWKLFRKRFGFSGIRDVAVTSKQQFVLLDENLGRMIIIDQYGKTIKIIEPATQHCGRLRQPQSLACDSSDNIIVADTGNRRVLLFSASGSFSVALLSMPDSFPHGVFVTAGGLLYVTVTGNCLAQVVVYQL